MPSHNDSAVLDRGFGVTYEGLKLRTGEERGESVREVLELPMRV